MSGVKVGLLCSTIGATVLAMMQASSDVSEATTGSGGLVEITRSADAIGRMTVAGVLGLVAIVSVFGVCYLFKQLKASMEGQREIEKEKCTALTSMVAASTQAITQSAAAMVQQSAVMVEVKDAMREVAAAMKNCPAVRG